jgi:glycosyltransferase involved in cell wall biosynthesis
VKALHCIQTMTGGGAERQLAYLAAHLGATGWDVHVALTRRGTNWARLERSGAVIHELSGRSPYDPRLFAGLRRVMREVAPDIVQTWLLQMHVFGGLAAIMSRRPWIFSERASAAAYQRSLRSITYNGMARFASAIVSNSRTGDRYWKERLGDRVTRYVIPNGVPTDEIGAEPPATDLIAGIAPGRRLVLFAGRLEAQKNIEVLLRALGIVLDRHPDVGALCCGEGPLRGSMDRWIAGHMTAGRIRVGGYEPRLWGVMKRASVFVSPSLFEGSPNVVLEAMAAGTPLVVSDIPEHRELLDETCARLVDPASPEKLAGAIEDVLRDPAGAAGRARVAAERAASYGLPAIARRYSEVYHEVLSGARPQGRRTDTLTLV